MGNSYTKLDQALKDLIEAFRGVQGELDEKHGEDEDAYEDAVIEVLETSIETALEEEDISSHTFAEMLDLLTEALEQYDPAAFEGSAEEDYDADEEVEYDLDDDIDLDEEDE